MKKFFMMAIAVASITLMSCTSEVESKALDYSQQTVEAISNGDAIKAAQISKEAAEYAASLSAEDRKLFYETTQKYMDEHKEEIENAAKEGIGNALKNLF